MKITMPQPVAEVKYGGYASGNELVWTKGAGLQFLPAGTKLYAASVHAPTPVAYLDVGAGGYMYLGTDLTEDQVGSFPWGRHILAIVGTYGADGYVPAELPFDYSEAYQFAQQDLAIWKRRALEAELRVRDQDQIIDRMGDDLNAINGPTFMGEPLLPKQSAAPAASDVGQLLNDLFEFFESSGIDPGNGIALRLASALTTPQPSAPAPAPAPAPVEQVEQETVSYYERAHGEKSPTHGMSLDERIAHVGGRTNAAGYMEFGSVMAVSALIDHVLRDSPAPKPAPTAAQDVACSQSRESSMVVLERDEYGKPAVWCDPEIADLVSALNEAGIRTVASCSGHGHRPGNIMLADGRELVIARDFDEARKIDAMFPGINGEPPMVDVAGLVEALEHEFPLLQDDGLDEVAHHCEWAIQQDRKRLHALIAAHQQREGD